MNFANSESINSPSTVKSLASEMKERGIKPELELFDFGMANYMKYLESKELLKPPFIVNFILGGVASAQPTLSELGLLVSNLPDSSVWSVGGIGRAQLTANALGLVGGGGVRVGLEDNLFFDSSRDRLASNFELVERVLDLGKILGRRPMSPETFREKYLNG
jgi:uncharacterized protein (DUF849 family)